ncbi:hypothetical protein D7V93_02465 [Corallococcus llansteffanensis]|uniref:Uncharacterized protein n=1 Tax=Corallococcus llansteffanensis TaxID=2316731 RepID=A0A3A8QGE1_9BACT|nr:hypothetical protein D7V93_02465 [Corallococcus llansteffanensis]
MGCRRRGARTGTIPPFREAAPARTDTPGPAGRPWPPDAPSSSSPPCTCPRGCRATSVPAAGPPAPGATRPQRGHGPSPR